jgi:two-component system phosphate regulon response regulator PhoB
MRDAPHAFDQTVLVADDEDDLLTLMARRLSRAGYRVVTAADGADAWTAAVRELPHLAVLDVMMPGLTGIEVARRLRADDATRAIPVILISASHPGDTPDGGLPGGAVDFIRKPFGAHELTDRVQAALSTRTRADKSSG